MRKILALCGLLGGFCALGPAANYWNGTLLNYDCFKDHKSVKGCGAKPTTDRFMLYCDKNKQFRFDTATNDRTRAAMQARASKSTPWGTKRTPVYARVTGSFKEGGKFHADTIAVK